MAPSNRLGVPQEQYKFTLDLTPTVKILHGGKSADRSILKPQTMVSILEQDGRVRQIEVRDD